MAAKTSKKKKNEEVPSTVGEGLFVLLFLPCLLVICIFLFDSQGNDDRYLVDLSRTTPHIPEGMPGALEVSHEFDHLTKNEQSISIFDTNLGSVVRQVYESSPFVRRVTTVRRQFPGGLEVEVEFRQPYAAVEVEGRYILVDQYGELLPYKIAKEDLVPPIITIHPESDLAIDPGKYEEKWLLQAIAEGIQILKDMAPYQSDPLFRDITILAIDVSNHGGRLRRDRPEISLVSDRTWFDPKSQKQRPTMLAWGRSTQHPQNLIELSVKNKIEHLRQVQHARPKGIAGLRRVDLRFDKVYFVENQER